MATLVIFTENKEPSCYKTLATPERHIEIMPLAAALIGERTIDLSIIDCGNIVEDGLRMLKELKLRHVDVPVIFITEVSSEATIMSAFKLGARDFFVKPLDLLEFEDSVTKILRFKLDQSMNRRGASGIDTANITELLRLPDNLPERLLRATNFIDEHLCSPLSLEMIAAEACLSKYHFCRQFKRHVGVSPMLYCVYRRIEYARQILGRPSQTVTMAAFKSGFNDVTEFIRQFKKITGVTPGAYQKSFLALSPSK